MDDNPMEFDQIQAEINIIISKEKVMRQKLPETIKVSVFEISCKQMKQLLSEKYTTLQKNLIGMISKKAKSESQTLFNSFSIM